jgi:hypothetical protein
VEFLATQVSLVSTPSPGNIRTPSWDDGWAEPRGTRNANLLTRRSTGWIDRGRIPYGAKSDNPPVGGIHRGVVRIGRETQRACAIR